MTFIFSKQQCPAAGVNELEKDWNWTSQAREPRTPFVVGIDPDKISKKRRKIYNAIEKITVPSRNPVNLEIEICV